ncbi:TIGR00730 family Rossman fold protein [Actinacidiphila glaucinigra]|uniref:LOG family protein n=1 Tax=Actinacidiphila glaucinigra TaxID=235986 RepID=UPI00369186AC
MTTAVPPAVGHDAGPERPLRFTVFCGSSRGWDPAYDHAARTMGGLLAAAGVEIVYGGACIGLMGVMADTALTAGGRATGVIPEVLNLPGVVHPGLTRLEVVPDMATRKARLCELADAILVLPGGLGTLEELAEVWSWAQLGLHDKPIALLNTGDYFASLLGFLRCADEAGFLTRADRDLVRVDADPARLMTEVLSSLAPAEVTPTW